MTKILSTLVLFFLIRFVSFADIGCDAYKQQVVNDCNATISNVRLLSNDALAIINAVDLLKQDTNLSSYYGALDGISGSANTIRGYCVTSVTSIESIRDTALSLQCTSNTVGSCDCRDVLDSILSTLLDIQSDLVGYFNTLDLYHESIQSSLFSISSTSSNIFDFVSSVLSTNFVTSSNRYVYNNSFADYMKRGGETYFYNATMLYPFNSASALKNVNLIQMLKYGFLGEIAGLSSLNNYAYTNLKQFASIDSNIFKLNESIGDVTNILSAGFSNFNVDSPLSIFQSGSGDYHSFLTNYYVRVSSGATAGSASEPHTNWFSRIEMLLAALVFQPQGSNFVNDAELDSQISQIQSSFDSSLDDLQSAVELPSGFEETIRDTGKSFLDVLGGFHDAISGNSLPSTFTLVDINLSNSRSSNSRSGENLNRLTLETPVSGSFLSFLEVCHAVTTICFTMLFCYWSIKFVIFFCSKIAKLISVCFHVFASLIGSS